MNLFQLLTNEEQIAGIDISDTKAKLVLIEKNKKQGLKIKTYAEELLNDGAITGGIVNDENKFSEAIGKILKKTQVKDAIITIKADIAYTKLLFFASSVISRKLEDSMKLIKDFQLPKKTEDIYFDWEKTTSSESNSALLALIDKSIVDNLISILEKNGLNVIALEFHSLSLARVIKQNEAEPALFLEKGEKMHTAFIIKDNVLRFQRSIPAGLNQNELSKELLDIRRFYEYNDVEIKKFIMIGNFPESRTLKFSLKASQIELSDLYKNLVKPEYSDYSAIAIGAAARGLMSRNDDTYISLMRIGTEEASRQHRLISFVDFISKFTIIFSLFCIIVFAASWILMVNIRHNFNDRINFYNSFSLESAQIADEEKARSFNDLMGQTGIFLKNNPYWSILLNELNSLNRPGIGITNLTISSVSEAISVTGIAENRNLLNSYKKSLENSKMFSNVNLPLNNLEMKENIPFAITFRLAEETSLYIK